MTHFRRYTCSILRSQPLWVPATTCTSSSLRTGTDRALYLLRWSAERGALISTLRTFEGAAKCSFRYSRQEPDTRGLYFTVAGCGVLGCQHFLLKLVQLLHPGVPDDLYPPLLNLSRFCIDIWAVLLGFERVPSLVLRASLYHLIDLSLKQRDRNTLELVASDNLVVWI
ncbi:hypothetical protein OPV22_022644 [Ensete ventricosum]|uniref:Uncharacterized protein n=1 Tax=Ensete ventricosum TaxID=4639 RepID=A0AAV8QK21_ENSVE|nr:hypothetical protein OPV22_022644 [Ensete ventricosum]